MSTKSRLSVFPSLQRIPSSEDICNSFMYNYFIRVCIYVNVTIKLDLLNGVLADLVTSDYNGYVYTVDV